MSMKVQRICQICSSEFTTRAVEVRRGNGKFCSNKCVGVWISQNWKGDKHPRWKGYGSPTARTRAMKKRDPFKALARNALAGAVYKGRIIKPECCSKCGEKKLKKELEGHHENYSKRFDVVWLCRPCHKALHKKNL